MERITAVFAKLWACGSTNTRKHSQPTLIELADRIDALGAAWYKNINCEAAALEAGAKLKADLDAFDPNDEGRHNPAATSPQA